ncbi:MAG: V-type ATP synthase subunit D [Kiritimatiellia bacterium]
MAKIKHTKNELKSQQEALRRYQRFLPMLQLKKQQLQAEIQHIDHEIQAEEATFKALASDLKEWVALFTTDESQDAAVILQKIDTLSGNIAGVNIPILQQVHIDQPVPDLFLTPAWIDDAQDRLADMIRQKAAIQVHQKQRELVNEELRTTSQRVNLFEKVKIPECKENIRTIKIYLGDEQTASVARGKIAKKRSDRAPVEQIHPEKVAA